MTSSAQTPLTPEEIAQVEQLTREIMPAEYHDPTVITRGSQRAILNLNWGPRGIERVGKLDFVQAENPRAELRADNGHGTYSEIDLIQKIPNPEQHGIDAPIAFVDRRHDKGAVLSIHRKLNGETLEQRVGKKPLDFRETVNVFSQLFDTSQHYRKSGVLHRDYNPVNIFLENNGKVTLMDFANGCEDSKCDDRVVLSVGGRATDPVLVEGRGYTESSEIHGQSTALAYSITGKYFTKADTLRKRLIAIDTDESLLDEKGQIDVAKYNAALERYLAQVPKDAKRLVPFLKRGLSLDNRFDSLTEAVNSFKKCTKPTLTERARRNWKAITTIAATGLVAASCIGLGGYKQHQVSEERQKQAVAEASKYEVVAKMNGSNLEIDNNLVELKNPRITEVGDWSNSYPRVQLLHVKPGDHLDVDVFAKEKPWNNSERSAQFAYSGRMYFEGSDGTNFSIYPDSFNEAYTRDMGTAGWQNIWKFPVPSDLKEGVRNFVIELYAPEKGFVDTSHYKDARDSVKFSNPGKIICRKVIPVIVGNPQTQIHLSELKLEGYAEQASFRTPDKDNDFRFTYPKGMKYRVSIPEDGYTETFDSKVMNCNMDGLGLGMPKPTNTLEKTLVISALEGGTNEIYTTCIPVAAEKVGDQYWRTFGSPGTNFYKKAQEQYRALNK